MGIFENLPAFFLTHSALITRIDMQTLYIHPQNPQKRLLEQVANALKDGKIIAYPTDIGYALLTHLNAKQAIEQIKRIEQVLTYETHTLLCQNISDMAKYANINNAQFRHIKASDKQTRFILTANKEVPKYLLDKNKNIGIQSVNSHLLSTLLDELDETIIIHELNPESIQTSTPYDIEDSLDRQIDLLVHADIIEINSFTTDDLTSLDD